MVVTVITDRIVNYNIMLYRVLTMLIQFILNQTGASKDFEGLEPYEMAQFKLVPTSILNDLEEIYDKANALHK